MHTEQVIRKPSAGVRAILVLAIGTFATGTDAFIVAGLVPDLGRSLDTSVATAGQIVTVFALAYAVGSPLITTATAPLPRRPLLVGTLILFAFANVLCAVSPTIVALAAARVVAALLAGLFVPAASASAAALARPEMRGRALAIVLGGTALSTVFGVPIGLSVGELAGWRGAFVFVAALALVAAAAVAALLPAVDTPPRLSVRDRVAMLRRPDINAVLLVTICANAGGFCVYTYMAAIFDGLGGDGTFQALIFAFGVAAVLGGYLAGLGSDRWGPVPVLAVILAVFTVNHFLLPVWSGALATSFVYVVVWGVVGWGTVPPQQHRLVGRAGPGAAIALSLNASALCLGIALGGLVGGVIMGVSGPGELGLAAGAFGALALLLLPVSVAAAERRNDAPAAFG